MKKRFKKVYIEITNICNLDCNFCPKTSRKKAMMSVEQFKNIIQQVKFYTDYVYLHIMGEPLLHPNLISFLEICNQNKLKVNLTTNGTLIQKNREVLLNSPSLRQINISLHSYEANISGGGLREYVGDILDFINEVRNNSNIICSMRLWNMDAKDLKGANELNFEIINMIEKKLCLTDSLLEQLFQKRQIKLSDQVYLNMAEKFQWPDINRMDTAHEVFCYGLRNQFGILVDGTVVPCCLDSEGTIALGNIYDQPLEEILTSERATCLYEGFSKRVAVEELCKRCGYAKRF